MTEQEAADALKEWLATRPPVIQELARLCPPGRLYRMKSSGHQVLIVAYSEDGTLIVGVWQKLNPGVQLVCERKVFGVLPEDLTEVVGGQPV